MSAAGSAVIAEINSWLARISGMSLAITSWDFLLWAFFGLAAFFYGLLFVSRGKLVPIFVSTFVSLVLVQLAPFLDSELGSRFGLEEIYQVKLAAFAISFSLLLLFLSRVIFQAPVGAETFGMIGSFALSLSQVGFLTATIVSFLPKAITNQFSDLTTKTFLSNDVRFYWAAAAAILLLLFARKANKEVG